MLTYNPDERPAAKDLLKENYFKEERELDQSLITINRGLGSGTMNFNKSL